MTDPMTTLPDLEPAALEAAKVAFREEVQVEVFAFNLTVAISKAIRAYLAARSTVPEAGKAVDNADGIPFELVVKVENRIAYRISLGSTPRAIAEDVLQLALASVPGADREVKWLIERKYPTNSIGATEPRWYAERPNGDHFWTPVPNEAKRFTSRAEAEEYPAYRMIASDPTISITEHVWINDGFSWSHGRAALASVPAPSGTEPVTEALTELHQKMSASQSPIEPEFAEALYSNRREMYLNAGPQAVPAEDVADWQSNCHKAVDLANRNAARAEASEAEATSLRRKLEEAIEALTRLSSPEAFCSSRMANDEERARMFYADEALASIRALSEREGQDG